MFELFSSIIKYIFITIIYIFLFAIIRLIYLDVRSMNKRESGALDNTPYLKLVNRRHSLNFKVEESYSLYGTKIIGRSAGNQICIQDPYLSNVHSQLEPLNETFSIKDMGSKNGTFVNNTRISDEPVELKNGDTIQLGQINFLFVDNNS
jgi:hypothetical protein